MGVVVACVDLGLRRGVRRGGAAAGSTVVVSGVSWQPSVTRYCFVITHVLVCGAVVILTYWTYGLVV